MPLRFAASRIAVLAAARAAASALWPSSGRRQSTTRRASSVEPLEPRQLLSLSAAEVRYDWTHPTPQFIAELKQSVQTDPAFISKVETDLAPFGVSLDDVLAGTAVPAPLPADQASTAAVTPTKTAPLFVRRTAPQAAISGQTVGTSRNNYAGWVGFEFTTQNSALSISQLGRWVISGNSKSHAIKLVDAATNQDVSGGSVTVNTSGAAAGRYLYGNLPSSVTLLAHHSYYLLSQEVHNNVTPGSDSWYDTNTNVTPTADITIPQSEYGDGSGYYAGALPNANGPVSYGPVNFMYPPVSGSQAAVASQTLGNSRNNYGGWVGFEFTTKTSTLVVTQLGRWVVSGNSKTHAIKLVDASTSQDVAGASVTVNTSGATAGQYLYGILASPVTLAANHSYYLLSQEVNNNVTPGSDSWYDTNTNVTPSADITIPQSEFGDNGAYAAGALPNANGPVSYGPVNFLYTGSAAASSGVYNYSVNPHALTFNFQEPMYAANWAAAVTVIDLNTGSPVSVTTTASGSVSGVTYTLGSQYLPDGNYVAVLHGSQVTDSYGNPLTGSDGIAGHDYLFDTTTAVSSDFWFLWGDFNRNRGVGNDDYSILQSNYNGTGKSYSQGDMNYDGKVDISDFTYFTQHSGNALPALGPAAMLSLSRASGDSALISWGASTDQNVTAYDVYRNSQRIAADVSGTAFLDSGLASSTAYSYMVVARDSSGHSSYPTGILYTSTTAPPSASVNPPTSVTANGDGTIDITVYWTPSTTPGVTYSIYLGTEPSFALDSNSLVVSGLDGGTSQYTITGLDPSQSYYPVVVSVLPGGATSDPNQGTANGGNPTTIGIDPGVGTDPSNPDPAAPGITSSGGVSPNDDSYSPQVDLGFQINFYGKKYTQLYVNNNGNLTLDSALSSYTPEDMTQLGLPMIAPFWADVDTRTDINPDTGDSGCGTVTYKPTTVGGHRAFEADWTGVGYYNLHSNLKNTFSVQIIDRDDINPGDFDIIFSYYQIQWETGDASNGSNGRGGTPAFAGWTNGTLQQGDSYQLPGSGVSGGLIGSTGQRTYQIRNIDLALDSDNNNDTDPPDRNSAEENVQDEDGKPGKVVMVNDGDADSDAIPDYADGHNLDGSTSNDDGGTTNNQLVPVLVTVPNDFDFSNGTIKFSYDASDPMGVTIGSDPDGNPTYTLPAGHLRLWKKDGTAARAGASAASGGDFIPSDVALSANQIGVTSSNRTVTLYLEAVSASDAVGDQEITVSLDPNGRQGAASSDSARVTAISAAVDDVEANEVDLDWTGPTDAQSYTILRAPKASPDTLTTVGTAGPDDGLYQDISTAAATDYVYRIEAHYTDGTTARSGPIDVTTPPLPPINLRISSIGQSSVSLSWQADPAATVPPEQYQILRSDDSDPTNLAVVGTVGGTTTTYQDVSLTPGDHYYYEISALWHGADSGTAETAMAFVKPAAAPASPTGLAAAVDPSGAMIDITWTNADATAARVRVERSSDYGQTYQTVAYASPDLAEYDDPYVAAGVNYVYRVRAENATGISGASNTANLVAPAGAAGEQGAPPLPDNSIPVPLTDQWVGSVYADGEIGYGGTKQEINLRMNLDAANAKLQQDGFTSTIDAFSLNDGRHGVFHVYKSGIFSGGAFVGSVIFDATDQNDMLAKLADAETSSRLGTINTAAETTKNVVELGTTVAAALIPGPDDVLLGAAVQAAAAKLTAAGTKAFFQAGKWVFEKAGKALAGGAEKKAAQELRGLALEELGAKTVKWTNYKDTHIVRGSNVNWSDVIKSTKGPKASAKYLPSKDVEMIERAVWQNGTPVTSGKNWKVYEFEETIGASDGKQVKWVRVEATGGPGNLVIHGHPITQEEYQKLIKPR